MNSKFVIGICFWVVGFFWQDIESLINKESVVPSIDYNKILDLKKPNDKIHEELKDIKEIVSGPEQETDREMIAVFNNEMAKRLVNYKNVNTLSFENYYYDAGKTFYQGRLRNKYGELGNKMYKVILSTLGDNDSYIKDQEFQNLSEKMKGVAWILLN